MSNTNDFNYDDYQPDLSLGVTTTPHENETEAGAGGGLDQLGGGVGWWRLAQGERLATDYMRHHASVGQRIAQEDAYDITNDRIHTLTGRRLGNPVRERFGAEFDQNGIYFDPLAGDPTNGRYSMAGDPLDAWHAEVARMAATDPRLNGLDTSRAAMAAIAEQRRISSRDNFEAYMASGNEAERLLRGLLMMPGMVAGGVSSGAPEQVAQLPLLLGGLVGAAPLPEGVTYLSRFLAGSGSNLVLQGVAEPIAIEDARQMGRDYPSSQVAIDFATAGILGGVMHEAAPLFRGERLPVINPALTPRFLRDTVTPLERMAEERRTSPPPPPPPPGGAGSGVPLGEALQGQGERLVVAAHARDAATVAELPEHYDPVTAAQEIAHNQRFVNGEESAPYQADPPRVAEEGRVLAARDEANPPPPGTVEEVRLGGTARPRTYTEFDPRTITADPAVFQYKEHGNTAGENEALAGVQTWDGQSGGTVAVFERADGTRVIADGHQRRALALRAIADGQRDVTLRGYLYREKDGWTANDVRDLAAQSNLRAGTGTVFDTAGLLRDAPELLDSTIPRNAGQFRIAHGLARLSEPAYRAVRAGVIEPRLGQIIGEVAVDHPEIHEALVNLFKEHPPATLRDAAFIVREAMEAPRLRENTAQLSMFGDAPELVAMQNRVAILRHSETAIRSDRMIFAAAERNADALQEAGNVLAADENTRRKQLADALLRTLDVLATRHGPVSTLLRRIEAEGAADMLTPKQAAGRFVSALRTLLDETPLTDLMHDPAPAVEPPPAKMPDSPTLDAEQYLSAVLADAGRDDEEALQAAIAEVALLRANKGGEPVDMPPTDALGWSREHTAERVLDAGETLGITDPTVHDRAIALLAHVDEDMINEAHERLTPQNDVPAEGTFELEGNQFHLTTPFGEVHGRLWHDNVNDMDTLKIDGSGVIPRAQGEGHGVEMYLRLLKEAHDRALPLVSDRVVSEEAAHVYEALERRGYVVTKSPDAKLVDGSWHNAAEPVFHVDSTPPENVDEHGPATHLDVAEIGGPIKSPFNPFDMADVDTLRDRAGQATLPELRRMQREFGFGNFNERTREELAAAMEAEWRDVHEAPQAVGSAKGQPAQGMPRASPLMTVAEMADKGRRAFPRLQAQWVKRARITYMRSFADMSAGARGQFARLLHRALTPEARSRLAQDFVRATVRKYATGESDLFAWRAGHDVMAASVTRGARGYAEVSFGRLTAKGVDVLTKAGGDLRSALNTMTHAMAAIDQHIREHRLPVYGFGGATESHNQAYSLMADYLQAPAGYSIHKFVNPDGDPYSFFIVRNDYLKAHDGILFRAVEDARKITPEDMMASQGKREDAASLEEKFHRLAAGAVQGEDMFSRSEGAILGFASQGRAYLFADHTLPEQVAGVHYHELGSHVGAPEMLGPEGHAYFLSEAERLFNEGDPDLREGHALAKAAGTPDDQIWHETVAYAMQYADWSKMTGGLRYLIRRLVNSARAWLWRTWPSTRTWSHLTFNDMQHLIQGAMRHAARNDPRPIYDRVEGQFARGRDAGEWRGDKRFDAEGLTETQRAYAEMALNNFRDEDIADEWDVPEWEVRKTLEEAHSQLVSKRHAGIPGQRNYDTSRRTQFSTPDLFRMRNKYTWVQMSEITGIDAGTLRSRVSNWEKRHWDAPTLRRQRVAMSRAEISQVWALNDELKGNRTHIANRMGRSTHAVRQILTRPRPEWAGGEPISPGDVLRDNADRIDNAVDLLKDCK